MVASVLDALLEIHRDGERYKRHGMQTAGDTGTQSAAWAFHNATFMDIAGFKDKE